MTFRQFGDLLYLKKMILNIFLLRLILLIISIHKREKKSELCSFLATFMCTGNTSNNNTFNGWSGTGNIWFHHLPKNILQWQRKEIDRSATCWKIAKWHGFYQAFFFNKSFNIKVLRLMNYTPPPKFLLPFHKDWSSLSSMEVFIHISHTCYPCEMWQSFRWNPPKSSFLSHIWHDDQDTSLLKGRNQGAYS